MAPLCSRTGLVGPLPKGRWRLSWRNRRHGRNFGSLIRNTFETSIKWMEAPRVSSSKKSESYAMFLEGDVHCGVWHWWGNTAPCCTSKADGKRCLLLHVPAAPLSSSAQDKTTTVCGTNTIILYGNERSLTASAVPDLLHCWQWEIVEHPPYSPDMSPC